MKQNCEQQSKAWSWESIMICAPIWKKLYSTVVTCVYTYDVVHSSMRNVITVMVLRQFFHVLSDDGNLCETTLNSI